jgi:hypothetical protein
VIDDKLKIAILLVATMTINITVPGGEWGGGPSGADADTSLAPMWSGVWRPRGGDRDGKNWSETGFSIGSEGVRGKPEPMKLAGISRCDWVAPRCV